MGVKPPWAGRARRAVAEGGYSGRYSEVAGKGCQGHSFEPEWFCCSFLDRVSQAQWPGGATTQAAGQLCGGPHSGLTQTLQLRLSVGPHLVAKGTGLGVSSLSGTSLPLLSLPLSLPSPFPASSLPSPQARTAVLSSYSSQLRRVSPRNLPKPSGNTPLHPSTPPHT